MQDDLARLARRDALAHAQRVFGAAQDRRELGVAVDVRNILLSVRHFIAERGIPGAVGTQEHVAGSDERATILAAIDQALSGGSAASGFDMITIAERIVQERLKAFLF